MDLTLYIGNKNYSSWSLRPWLLLTELDIPFDEKLHPFTDGGYGSSWERFRSFSPTGLVPCLTDGDITIWESMAIVEYVAELDERVWPHNAAARAWARSAAAEMHAGFSTLRNVCPMSVGVRVRLHDVTRPLTRDLDRIEELWAQGLGTSGGPFLTGAAFTAVDAFYAPVVFRLQTYGLARPGVMSDYVAHMLDLDGMTAWAEAALAETWRETERGRNCRAWNGH